MFCPKCGTKNPEDGKFCRKCGTDIGPVSELLTGKPFVLKSSKKEKELTWESVMGKLFTGLSFLIIAIILGLTNAAGGRVWWFWLLIPGFAMLGHGVAQFLQMKQDLADRNFSDLSGEKKQLLENQRSALPPSQTDYVSPVNDRPYSTGDLVPGSVVENTTRHLEMDSEGETVSLPKDKI